MLDYTTIGLTQKHELCPSILSMIDELRSVLTIANQI